MTRAKRSRGLRLHSATTAQDATHQGHVTADAFSTGAVLCDGLAAIVHAVVWLDGEFLGPLGDVGHFGAVQETAGHGATHVLSILSLVDATAAGHVTGRHQVHLLFINIFSWTHS